MNSLLVVIDLQQAFINENTNEIVLKIEKLVDSKKYNNVVFTKFVNSISSVWFTKLNYQECITEESKRIVIDTREAKIIDKTIYSSLTEELKKYIKINNIDEVYLCGIDTECCVLKTALDMFENGYNVYVLKDYCASCKGKDRHNNALDILKRNIGSKSVL